MNKNVILKLAPYVLKRFEENINDEGGLMFLYNSKTNECWSGNSSSRFLINNLDGENSLNQLYDDLIANIFSGYTKKDVEDSFNSIVEELIEKNFLEEICN